MTQMNLFEGRHERDAGTARTLAKSLTWAEKALPLLAQFAKAHPEGFLAEEFREYWLAEWTGIDGHKYSLDPPHSEKCWGALFLNAARRGMIHNTGCYEQAASKRNHAHRYAVWAPPRIGEGK